MNIAQRSILFRIVLWAFFILSPSAPFCFAGTSTYWLCRRVMEVRTLRIENGNNNCMAWYTKAGIDSLVGEAKEPQKCRVIVDTIKATLEGSGWNCKNISGSSFSE